MGIPLKPLLMLLGMASIFLGLGLWLGYWRGYKAAIRGQQAWLKMHVPGMDE